MSITIISTGGTIDKEYPKTVGGYAFEMGESAAAKIMQLANTKVKVNVIELMKKDSLDVNDTDRQTMSDCIKNTPHSNIILTHGTSTMTKTAAFLSRNVSDKTVVLTGAFKPACMIHSDAPFSVGLACAAAQLAAPGIYIAMQGRVYPWDKVLYMMDPLQEKYTYISQWCHDLGVTILPMDDMTPSDVNRLYGWAREEEALDRVDHGLRKKIRQMEKDSIAIETTLSTLQLLDTNKSNLLKDTITVAAKLGVKQVDPILITSSMSDLRSIVDEGETELEEITEQLSVAKINLSDLKSTSSSLDTFEHLWTEDIPRREATAASNDVKTSTHLEKVSEYQHRLSKMQSRSLHLGMSTQLKHSSLTYLLEDYISSVDKLTDMQSKVANHKLPPNISKARAAVMELEAEVKNLQRRK